MKTTKTIIAALTALTLCLAVGCGGAEQEEPRPPELVDIVTGKTFAKYDGMNDEYVTITKVHLPANLVVHFLTGRVTADWGDNDLADQQRLTTVPLPNVRDLEQTRAE